MRAEDKGENDVFPPVTLEYRVRIFLSSLTHGKNFNGMVSGAVVYKSNRSTKSCSHSASYLDSDTHDVAIHAMRLIRPPNLLTRSRLLSFFALSDS